MAVSLSGAEGEEETLFFQGEARKKKTLGGVAAGREAFAARAAFQALGTAIEGTYYPPDSKDKPVSSKRPLFMRTRGGVGEKSSR